VARHKFPGDSHWLLNGGPAVNAPFTVWNDLQAGSQITDLLAADGVSGAVLQTDANGLRPTLWGPDGVEVIFIDTGASIRYPVTAIDRETVVLDEAFLTALTTRIAALEAGGGTGTGGGGLPAGTTLDSIPNGSTRWAVTPTQSGKIDNTPTTFVTVGTAANQAMRGDRTFTALETGAVANTGGASGILVRTIAQGLPASVTDGLIVVIPSA
jgi:hypothetical protein